MKDSSASGSARIDIQRLEKMKFTTLVLLMFPLCGLAQLPEVGSAKRPAKAEATRSTKVDKDVAAAVMDSTFKLAGKKDSIGCFGTGFVLQQKTLRRRRNILFTAAHVFKDCVEPDGTIVIQFRERIPNDPTHWKLSDSRIRLKSMEGKELWTRHPLADVAAIPLQLPPGVITTALPISALAGEETFADVYVGQSVFVLGYRYGTANLGGFPFVNRGDISSRSVSENSMFALSFQVLPGDSGGPVYSIDQTRKGYTVHILGILCEALVRRSTDEKPKGPPTEVITFVGVGFAAPAGAMLAVIEAMDAPNPSGIVYEHE
jgi:hypothetical protein